MMQNTMAPLAYDVPIHFWHFSKNAIKCFCKRRNDARKVLPMKFDFYVSLLSEKYKNGKMNLIKAFDWFESNRRKQNFEYSSHIYVIKQLIVLVHLRRFFNLLDII
jgi:hypothetical protein